MSYGWIIDVDHIFPLIIGTALHDPSTDQSDTGVFGPSNLSQDIYERLMQGEGAKFRLYDDDGELGYEGRILGDYTGFEPLDDFGTPNAGCTEIKYLEENGRRWKTL